ncbi:hypothetical protein [Nostoc foliaceum]|uniref:Uncharacterized protein n=1 Tax=Nostoc linckia FACHB-391 TaxID=2692906 RepID=A0ABR8EZ29_NOSLI|nr:hypothetical protein [Nostoc foliaceum]MBD2562074.1 hypothetical protein [Nostoc linckia FACHB-391]
MFVFYNDKNKKLEIIEIKSGIRPLDIAINIFNWPNYFLINLFNNLVDKINSPGNLSQDDSENIIKIIEEGRKQKVSEMEIEMSRDVATGVSINGLEGVDVTIGCKGNTKYVMKVKYKYD